MNRLEEHERKIPEIVTPAGLRYRAEIMRDKGDEACARHLELAADKLEAPSWRYAWMWAWVYPWPFWGLMVFNLAYALLVALMLTGVIAR